jgi:hypothetical protein
VQDPAKPVEPAPDGRDRAHCESTIFHRHSSFR